MTRRAAAGLVEVGRVEQRQVRAGRMTADPRVAGRVEVGFHDGARAAHAQAAQARLPQVRARRAQEAGSQVSRHALPVALRRLAAVAALAVTAATVVAGGIVVSGFAAEPVAGGTTTVQQGESLWDIAAATGAQDVSDVVWKIVELNNLESTTLQPGQSLVLPAS